MHPVSVNKPLARHHWSPNSFSKGHTLPGNLLPNVGPGQPVHTSHQRPGAGPQGIHQQQQQQLPQQPSPTDMTAFNKLLGMMKQAGTLGQAQKEMVSVMLKRHHFKTRKHSSRMRTARLLGRLLPCDL